MARKTLQTSRSREADTGRLRLDLPNYLPYRITSLAALMRRAFAEIYREDPGLNEPEWKVLTTLAHYAPLSSGDLGHYITLDRVAVSRALARLIELGLVVRSENPSDQRTYTVDLTPRAARMYDRMAAQLLEIEEPILATLSPDETRELVRLLDKIETCFLGPADEKRMQLIRKPEAAAGRAAPKRRRSTSKL